MSPTYSDESLLSRLYRHANADPGRTAFTFLRDNEEPDALSFGQLAARVAMIADRLREQLRPGDRAVLLYPPGLEFICAFLGCLAAGVVAVPAYPPRLNRKADRLSGIIADCAPSAFLMQRSVISGFPPNRFTALVLFTDDWETPELQTFVSAEDCLDGLAFLQYTSGSTGSPRGVMVSHSNIVCNERQIQAAFRHSAWDTPNATSTMVTWLPLFHDMGLIGNVLQPLYVGFPSVLLSPVSFLQKPVRWLKAISEYGATTTGAPNFAYDLCVKTITEPEKETLDLSSVRVLYNGSEPVRAETIDRFVASFQQCGLQGRAFFPCYGLAEATLFVTGGPYDKEPSRLCVDADALTDGKVVPATGKLTRDRWLVSSGRPAEGTVIAAVDPVSRSPLPDGIVGELWVSSAAVSSGYYGRALESRQVFGNYFSNGEGPFLNTGDLGFLRSGEVYVTGRSKDLIIISGRNIYPQDVELVVESVILSIGPNSCAAFALEVGGKERLAIIVEADRQMVRDSRGLNEGEYCQSLSSPAVARLWEVVDSVCTAVLSEVEIAVQSMTFVRPGTFLRTSSGKVQRRAALAALQENAVEVVFTWDAEAPGVLSRTPRISSSHQASRTN